MVSVAPARRSAAASAVLVGVVLAGAEVIAIAPEDYEQLARPAGGRVRRLAEA